MLCIHHNNDLHCQELYFHAGVDKLQYLVIHNVSEALGDEVCKSLPGFHAVTGCDSTSVFSGLGKKKP
jgi:hypothetical protein